MSKLPKAETAQSRPATSDQPSQPSANDQSGSTGRPTGGPETGPGKDTAQDRYGQSGCGGKQDAETMGQASYRDSDKGLGAAGKSHSNHGSGRSDQEPEDKRRDGASTHNVRD